MSEPEFDTLLAARFEREHRHVPAEPFVAATLHRVRFEQRLVAGIRTGLAAVLLLAAILASPWLIAGAARLNAALESSLTWTLELPGAWVLGLLAIALVFAARVRR